MRYFGSFFILFFVLFTSMLECAERYASGSVIITLKNPVTGITSTALQAVSSTDIKRHFPELSQLGVKRIRRLVPHTNVGMHVFRAQQTLKDKRVLTAYNTFVLRFDPDIPVEDIIAKLKKLDMTYQVQPNHLFHSSWTPNDHYFSEQYALNLMGVPDAWDSTTGSSNIVVAVIDSGVDWAHADLNHNIWQNSAETINGIDDDGNGYIDDVRGWDFIDINQSAHTWGEDYFDEDNNPMDVFGHGTHVSGIIAAVANNAIGVAGTAPGCRIMPLRAGYAAYDECLFEESAIVDAIYYAVNNGAKIINMSFAALLSSPIVAIDTALQYALDHNVLLVAAAGNESNNLAGRTYVPATYAGVIAVSAVNENKELTDYSNYGSGVIAVAAPGGSDLFPIISTYPNNQYADASGTSMAAPFVSGVAALLYSKLPQATTQDMYNLITKSAEDLGTTGYDAYFGHGLVNAFSALNLLFNSNMAVTYNLLTTCNAGEPVYVTINAQYDLILNNWPRISIHYKYDLIGQPSGSWAQKQMTKSGALFHTELPAATREGTLSYYYAIESILEMQTIPSENPTANALTAAIKDLQAPTISCLSQTNDPFSDQISFFVTDNAQINDQSFVFTLQRGQTVATYSIASTIFNYQTLTAICQIDLSDKTQFLFNANESVLFELSATDIYDHTASQNVTLIYQGAVDSFQIYGAEGEKSPVINAPNPFDPNRESTRICYTVNRNAHMTFWVYSLGLRQVLYWERDVAAGYHFDDSWDGRDSSGDQVPNGVYLLVLQADSDGKKLVRRLKMAVLRR